MKYILFVVFLLAGCPNPSSDRCNGTILSETKGSNHDSIIRETDALFECLVRNNLRDIESFRDYPFLDIPILVMGNDLKAGTILVNGCTQIDSFLFGLILEFEIFIRSIPVNSSFISINRHELKHVILKLVQNNPDADHSSRWFSGNSPCPDGNEFVVTSCPDFSCIDDFFVRTMPRDYNIEPFDQLRANEQCKIQK